jgi:Na+/H+-translocating membrane pyrophosphatase
MARETTLKRMVYVGIGLVIAGAVFSAFVSIPRMATHPEVIEDGAYTSALFLSVIIPLIVAAFLLASFIPNQHNLKRIRRSLIVAEVVVILLSMMIAKGANYYSEYDFATLDFICSGVYLIAGILLIIVSVKIKRLGPAEKK